MEYQSLNDFLSKHRTKERTNITHTRIPGKDNGEQIYPGKYHIPNEEYDIFLKLYHQEVFINKKNEYLTEKQLQNGKGQILVDLDFRYEPTIKDRQHSQEHIEDLLIVYMENISNLMKIEPNVKIPVFVLEKPNVNTTDKNITKDGIHIIIGVQMEHSLQYILRDEVMKDSTIKDIFGELPLKNDYESIFDDGISKGHTNWQMYGSRKPNNESYCLSKFIEFEFDKNGEIQAENKDISEVDDIYLLKTASARYEEGLHFTLTKQGQTKLNAHKNKSDSSKIQTKNVINEAKTNPLRVNITDEDKELADIIDLKYIDNYNDWVKLIWACRVDNNLELAHYISKRGEKYDGSIDATEKIYTSFTDSRKGFSKATFYHYAKISDKEKYTEIRGKYHSFKEIDNPTENDIAKTFCKIFGFNHIYYDKKFYYFNGVFWEANESGSKLKISVMSELPLFYNDQIQRLYKKVNSLGCDESYNDLREKIRKQIAKLGEVCSLIQRYTYLNNIVGMIKLYIERNNDEIEWETKPYLFAFKNKIYDLKNMCWIEPCRDDYVCITTGYNYIEPTEEQKNKLHNLLDTIFPHKDEKKLYMTILATGLSGVVLEKFINANGVGGNGKGVLNELMETLLGNYAYNCANAVLLAPIKDGNNPTIANMKYKRMIFYREPDTSKSQKLNIATIKELTGGKAINARMNYSNDTKTLLCATHILECNERPKLSGRVDDAVVRRLIDIPFRSVFTANPKDYFGEYVFKKDLYYKSNEFQNEFKCVLFSVLLDYWKDYLKENENIDVFICDSVKERTNAYLEANDELKSWFDENYEQTGNRDDVIQIKNMYDLFKESDTWINMSKTERREMSKKGFVEKVSGNIHFRKYYKEREKSKAVQEKYGVQLMRNVLVGFKRIEKECMIAVCDEY